MASITNGKYIITNVEFKQYISLPPTKEALKPVIAAGPEGSIQAPAVGSPDTDLAEIKVDYLPSVCYRADSPNLDQ